MSEQPQLVFSIDRLYVKDISLEIPNAPQIFLERETPQVDVQIHNEAVTVSEGVYQVVLTATVTAKVKDKTMFLTEVGQAGIFQVRNIAKEELDMVLSIACPNILLPYLREAVSNTVMRAGFPPVVLAPMNFESLYMQRKQQEAAQAPAQPQAH
ncbi:MAG TPA: protein-export chaperone SecB [Burkholderiales bacterium]|nr:protein-export chaperone SecB [Burkholderiales bacterium]